MGRGQPHQQIAAEGIQEATGYQQRETFSPVTCLPLCVLGNTQLVDLRAVRAAFLATTAAGEGSRNPKADAGS